MLQLSINYVNERSMIGFLSNSWASCYASYITQPMKYILHLQNINPTQWAVRLIVQSYVTITERS